MVKTLTYDGSWIKVNRENALSEPDFVPWDGFQEKTPAAMQQKVQAFAASIQARRSVRDFSERPVLRSTVEQAIAAAGTAPSGANKQPWFFAVVADPERKQAIRAGAEACERQFYQTIQDTQWEKALEPLGKASTNRFSRRRRIWSWYLHSVTRLMRRERLKSTIMCPNPWGWLWGSSW